MLRRALLMVGVLSFLGTACCFQDRWRAIGAETPDEASSAAPLPTSEYQTRELRGWKLYVHPTLVGEQSEVFAKLLTLLDHQLAAIERRVPEPAVEKLREIPIWIEFNEPHHPCMCYHPDAGWLRENDMNPDKADAIEIANAENFISWTIDQPWMVLHELAHGYHELFLPDGYDNAAVSAAQHAAKERGNYESVRHVNGRDVRHYALTNPMEYFAEGTESYFGVNDFYPFVRTELETHDPDLAKLLRDVWKVSSPE